MPQTRLRLHVFLCSAISDPFRAKQHRFPPPFPCSLALFPPSISLSSTKGGKPTKQYAQWYGADYTAVEVEDNDPADVAELIEAWDGCTYVEALGEHPNVPGIGEVTQVCGMNPTQSSPVSGLCVVVENVFVSMALGEGSVHPGVLRGAVGCCVELRRSAMCQIHVEL